MSVPTGTATLDRLAEATDGHARAAQEGENVGGMPVSWVASPGTAGEVGAVLRMASDARLTVVPRGTGTKLGWGAAPKRADVLLDTTRLDELVEHAAGDLIVVAGAGRRLDDLQRDLAAAGQWLAVDPPRRGTLGGLVATASTGPTRLLHGPVRDLLIGATMVRADGVVARSGGKVVKNVAGYDIGKVLTGSFGTLGVITEVAFRLHPLPEAQSWVSVTVGPEALGPLVREVVHSHLVPSAVELDRPPSGDITLTVLLEGIRPGVEARTAEAVQLLGRGAAPSESAPHWWGREPGNGGGVLLKVTHETARTAQLVQAVQDSTAAAGVEAHLRGSVAVGTVNIGIRDGGDRERVARLVTGLRSAAQTFGGTVVVLEADPRTMQSLDVWGPVGGLELMRDVKHQFDPERVLAPGRFVGGI